MIKRLLPAALLLVWAIGSAAQQPQSDISTHALMIGVGSTRQLDTYLSPMEYSGPQYSVLRETFRATRLAQGRISHQSLVHALFTHTQNPAQNATGWGGMVGYDAAWHYAWQPTLRLRLLAGPMVGIEAGAIYHTRNGNNPVQAHLHLELSASFVALYQLRAWGYPIQLRYQADVPLLGCMFSPHYGQSYYEISEHGLSGNIVASHPANAPSVRQMFTADFPVGPVSLRAGYLCHIRQSSVHGIDSHLVSHSLLVGLVRRFSLIKQKDKAAQNAIL